MKMECDLVVDCINGSLPVEKKREEEIDKHVAICRECQELVELMGELPYMVTAGTFSAGMKARISAMVFEEKPDSYTMMFY